MVSGDNSNKNASRINNRFEAIARLTEDVRPQIVQVAVLAFINGALEAVFLLIIARTALSLTEDADSIQLSEQIDLSVSQSLWLASGLVVIRFLLSLVSVRAAVSLVYQVGVGLRLRLAEAFLKTSWKTQQEQPAGTLQQLVVSFPTQGSTLIYSLATSLGAAFTLAAMLAVSLIVNFWATLIVVVTLLLLSTILRPLRRRLNTRSNASIQPQVSFSNGVAQISTLGLEIHSFGVSDQVNEEMARLVLDEGESQRRVGAISNSISPAYVSLAYLSVVGAVMMIALFGTEQLGSAGAVMIIMLRTLGYGQQLQAGAVSISLIRPFIETIENTTQYFKETTQRTGSTILKSIGDLNFDDICFSYETGSPVLSHLSFTIEQGEVIGIIGPSGSGKSTLVQLLLGVREPNSGTITAGGIDLHQIDRKSWTSKIAFVPQDANLITGTVADNIRFYRSGIDTSQMVSAARKAHILDDINSLPEGFDTHLGEHAQQLSGGQRQRLSIARALVNNPEILILDEPTSALDIKSESIIRDTIAALKGDVTVVIIAHRLSTLDVCSRLMVIENGTIKAFDTPARLAQDNDFYKEVIQISSIK